MVRSVKEVVCGCGVMVGWCFEFWGESVLVMQGDVFGPGVGFRVCILLCQ